MQVKITHLITSLKRGGRERQLATIIRHTNQSTFPSKIIFFNKSEPNYFDEYDLDKKAEHIVENIFFLRLIALHKLFKIEKPDIIYTWGNLESVFILLLRPFHRFKFINGSIRHGIRSGNLFHYFRTFILHLSRHIIANSRAGLKSNNLKRGYVLYNGIDDKFIRRITQREKVKHRKLLLKEHIDSILLISVANLVPYKDYGTILKALKAIKEENYKFHYLILGDGPLRNSIEQKIKEYNLCKCTTVLGSIQNVQDYLRVADILIHSSKGEGCSNAILEAMAAGLPVIASATGGTPEIVNEKNGMLFTYGNVVQLKKYIKYFLQYPEQYSEFSDNALRTIDERFSARTMIKNYYKIIRALV